MHDNAHSEMSHLCIHFQLPCTVMPPFLLKTPGATLHKYCIPSLPACAECV